jgi:hypothetical protein
MKIAITGHTKGIGKALHDKFKNHNHSVIGFSASTGFNIEDSDTIKEILDFSADCDVFINNAYHPVGQTALLKEFIKLWEGTDKLIINISSKSTLLPSVGEHRFDEIKPLLETAMMETYIKVKKEQGAIIREKIFENKPRIMNVILGVVDTEMATIFKSAKMQSSAIADLIYAMVQVSDRVSVQEVILEVPGIDWKDIDLNV